MLTIVMGNELEAPFIQEYRMVKLVGFLGTQAIYPLVFLANDALWPIENGIPLLLQLTLEGGPRQPILGYSKSDLTCAHGSQLNEDVLHATKYLTKHVDEFFLDLVNLAGLSGVSI